MNEPACRVAVVYRGDKHAPETLRPETGRLKDIFSALDRHGLIPVPAPFDDRDSSAFREALSQTDAALVWVNPIDAGRSRAALDDILREAASAGVLVSAHPDTVALMGVKSVLHRTRSLGWGTDTRHYVTPAAFAAEFPGLLAQGPRVLKRNRGNGGIGVWKVESIGGGMVRVQEARGDGETRDLALDDFMAQHRPEFETDGGLVDQPYQERLSEGMIRCYVSGRKVAGFGHQLVRALAPPNAGPGGPRLYSGPTDTRFQNLKATLEGEWIPQMCDLLGVSTDALPVIWDADFLLGPRSAGGRDSYVLCEINVSSVFPIPAEAPDAIAETLLSRLTNSRSPRRSSVRVLDAS